MVHGLTDMLMTASSFSGARNGRTLRLTHWAVSGKSFERTFDTHAGGEGLPDIIVAPGRLSGPVTAAEAAPLALWLLEQHTRGAVLASNCGGAFVLAETGLLRGRPVTTHWQFADLLQTRFPDLRVEPEKIVIDDGDIVTAGGLMAWTDLGMRLIDRLLGPSIMVETSRFFLVDAGGREQRHYGSFAPRLTHGDEAILRVQHWLQAKGARAISVTDMAREAGLEERTFQRRFKAATGIKPTEYVQCVRVEKARELLQFTKRTVDQIAWSVGYEDSTAFRRVFNRLVGVSPGDYRRRFGAGTEKAAA
ncbi:AraC family transcriptional regulator with amidase-like domain [Rhizobium sp. ERR 922]|nr:AraC family transcriptional regulator with amidase-like domain [Rhizobium sp. ERR 922]TWB90852.1 AraC family transcriptional regulator with amidase-like domain [Rhizobium sp. ERR 942]